MTISKQKIRVGILASLGLFVSTLCFAASKRTVFVHLMEWTWTDIASECENFLGPKGFAAVQVSPPQEHAIIPGYPWYQRYQPVSYQLVSRSGSRAEFTEMVRRCNAVGVGVYVDAVINHMSWVNRSNELYYGSAGTPYGRYQYNGTYQPWDFHSCDREIRDYNNAGEVQYCNLGTKYGEDCADLATEKDYVQSRIADYLNDLLNLGVSGFRIDAAKHIPADDLKNILRRLNRYTYIYSEVIPGHGQPIQPQHYVSAGDIIEFNYGVALANTFKNGSLSSLWNFGLAWNMAPTDHAIVFVNNHDTQRGHGYGGNVLTNKDGMDYVLANIFMLAWPYGYPMLMSSYEFEDTNAGPPSDQHGNTRRVYQNGTAQCFDYGWRCEHRWPNISRMVQFRNYTDGAFYVTKWWSDGYDLIAFGRGNLGYVVLNKNPWPTQRKFDTGLPPGRYCDAVWGEPTADGRNCTDRSFTVDSWGWAELTIPANDAVVLYGGSRLY